MEILSLFTISDFLAYLFPGILSLSGIYLMLLLTPLQYFIQPPKDIGGWFAFLVISYITGVLIAAVINTFFRGSPKSLRRQIKQNIQIHDEKLRAAVMSAFNNLILDQKGSASKKINQPTEITEWNASRYFVCRSLVMEMMPRAGANGMREGAYRQLRMNLIGSIVIWGFAGLLWGWVLLLRTNSLYEINGINFSVGKEWAWVLIVLSLIIPFYLISKLRKAMDKHEQREVREILTSFLAGYKAGIFDRRNK